MSANRFALCRVRVSVNANVKPTGDDERRKIAFKESFMLDVLNAPIS
jgi:hypothetical protein